MKAPSKAQQLLDYADRQIRWLFSFPAMVVMVCLFAYPLFRLIWARLTNEPLSSAS